jgi:hypothetical protein
LKKGTGSTPVWTTKFFKMANSIRIEYDDQAYDIIGSVNDALKSHGLKFVCDELEHDGFEIYELQRILPE